MTTRKRRPPRLLRLLETRRNLRLRILATRTRLLRLLEMRQNLRFRLLATRLLCQALLASPRSIRIRLMATRKRRPPVRGAAREPRSCHG